MSPRSYEESQFQFQFQFQSRNQTLTLIPGLHNDLASLILSFLPYSHHTRLKSVSKSWKSFLSSKIIIPIRQKCFPKSKLSHLVCIFPQDPSIASPYLFDPQNLSWSHLPPMPCNPHVYGLCNFTSIALGSQLYVIGGSLFDTRSYPLDRPSPSSSAFRFDFVKQSWDCLPPMLTPRGSFACAAISECDKILVAGGGSRHNFFGAAGSRMSSVEMYDVVRNEWVALDGLPRFRAGCVGFLVGNEVDREFLVMGGYGESRTVLGVFPVDEYYRDVVAMDLKNGGKWRELGDMWEEGERRRLGKTVVVDDVSCGAPGIFMIDRSDILRYDMASNRWWKETTVPRKITDDSSVGFVAVNGELHLMALLSLVDTTESRKARQLKRSGTMFIQIYNPRKKTWRTLITKPPFNQPLDFKTAVMCTIQL